MFEQYLTWISKFQSEIYPYFVQWIDGSFVTQVQNPRDLDFVTFLDGEVFRKREKKLEQFWSFANEDKGLDAYILPEFPSNHYQYQSAIAMQKVWSDFFSQTRETFQQQSVPKGFIQLKFEKL